MVNDLNGLKKEKLKGDIVCVSKNLKGCHTEGDVICLLLFRSNKTKTKICNPLSYTLFSSAPSPPRTWPIINIDYKFLVNILLANKWM